MLDGTDIMRILDEAYDGGAEKLANELDEDVDEITEKWSQEEGWIELQRHANIHLNKWWETNKS